MLDKSERVIFRGERGKRRGKGRRRYLRSPVEQMQIAPDALAFQSGRRACGVEKRARVHADDEIALCGAERLEERGGEPHDLYIRFALGEPDEVDVRLVELAQATSLRPLIAEAVADREPPQGEGELAALAGNHARQSRRHLGAEWYASVAAGHESIGLFAHDLFRRLSLVELRAL